MPMLNLKAVWSPPSLYDEGGWTTGGSGQSYPTMSGTTVNEDAAQKLSGVHACVKLVTESQGQLPLILYDRLMDGAGQPAKRRATGPLARRLRLEPADDLDRTTFINSMATAALFYPNAYAEKTYGPGGDVQLTPRAPARVRTEKTNAGVKRYAFLEEDNTTWRPIVAEDMFRLPGDDLLRKARESWGLAQAVQAASASRWRNGIAVQGFLATDPAVHYDEVGRTKVREAIERHKGAANAGGFVMLPEGFKWNDMGMSNVEAEFTAYSTWTIADTARWFGVPPYKVNITEPGSMSHASIESQSIEIVIYTLMPWIRRWEDRFAIDLLEDDRQFAEFLMAGLARGTLAERYAAYAIGRQWGWLSINDILRMENLDTIGAAGDTRLSPLNMTPVAKADGALQLLPGGYAVTGLPEAGSPSDKLAHLLASDAAGRILRKEVSAMARIADKHANDPAAAEQAIREFYDDHGEFVASTLHISEGAGLSYARKHRTELLTDGPSVVSRWETEGDDLTELAFQEAA